MILLALCIVYIIYFKVARMIVNGVMLDPKRVCEEEEDDDDEMASLSEDAENSQST
jgi:hypothetical protein